MQYLSTDALARMLDMTPEHVRDKLSKMHGFPAAIRVGGVLRWKSDEVEEWLESRKLSPAARLSRPMCNRCALRMMCFSEHCANEQYCNPLNEWL